jgi:hypothetical protein
MMLMLLLLLDLGIIGTVTTQGIEESEGSDDEWNYIKPEEKKESATAAPSVVAAEFEEENIPQQQVESSPTLVEPRDEEEEENQSAAAVDITIHSEFEENVSLSPSPAFRLDEVTEKNIFIKGIFCFYVTNSTFAFNRL